MVRRRMAGILVLSILMAAVLVRPVWADDTPETRELRKRIRALEEKVLKGKPLPASEHPWYERVAFSGGILSVLSGTSGYSDVASDLNRTGVTASDPLDTKERLDMSSNFDLFIEYPVGMHGLASAHLSMAKGDGVIPEMTEASGLTPFAHYTEQDLHDNNKLLEAWYEGKFLDGRLIWTFGLLDGTLYIDTNEAAGDETEQFMNAAFYDSPITGLPSFVPGMRITYNFVHGFYGTLLYVEGDDRSYAQDRLFARSDDFSTVYAAEIGWHVAPAGKEGNYRLYGWKDTTDFDRLDGTGTDNNQGFGLSFDQHLTEHLTLFGRYSAGEKSVLDFSRFYNLGLSFASGRDTFGFAAGTIRSSDAAKKKWSVGGRNLTLYEKGLLISELFYRRQVTETLSLTPDLQYTKNPLGSGDLESIWVASLRLNVSF
ncbi:MAG: carbohydrate porin [Deltaproteobacteria bacterium]|nr:carbohydrate porin [Deltaproteobacteria bacterium]